MLLTIISAFEIARATRATISIIKTSMQTVRSPTIYLLWVRIGIRLTEKTSSIRLILLTKLIQVALNINSWLAWKLAHRKPPTQDSLLAIAKEFHLAFLSLARLTVCQLTSATLHAIRRAKLIFLLCMYRIKLRSASSGRPLLAYVMIN